MSAILGSGKHRYRVVENWAKLPPGWEFRDVAAVAVDSKDRVYVFNRGQHPMIVFDQDGNFLRSWGEGLFSRAHGIDIDSDEIFDWPWLYAVGIGDWKLNDSQAARLRKYFDRGGFLVVDDFHGESEWDQFMAGIEQVYPDARVEDLQSDHPIFHTVYDLSERLQVPGYQIVERGSMWERNNGINPYWRVISDEKGRVQVAAFLNQDLGDAWEFSNDPAYPEQFASMAYRVGVNYVVYSMTH